LVALDISNTRELTLDAFRTVRNKRMIALDISNTRELTLLTLDAIGNYMQ